MSIRNRDHGVGAARDERGALARALWPCTVTSSAPSSSARPRAAASRRGPRAATGLALVVLALAACRTAEPPPSQTLIARPAEVAILGPGDVVEIRVFREPDLAGTYRVSADGRLDFPLIGAVQLGGRKPAEVEDEIRARLADGYLKDPQVSVFVRELNSQKIHVLGQVNKSGTFPYEPRMTIIQAVTNAGGFTKLAAANRVSLTRMVNGVEQTVILRVGDIGEGLLPNFELLPGDIVFVPESLF